MPENSDQLISPAELRELEDAAIASRSVPGVWAGLAMVQILLLAGTYPKGHALAVSLVAIISTGACLTRLLLTLRKDDLYPRNPRRWRFLYGMSLFLFSSAWGLLSASSYLVNGYFHWNSLLLMFCTLAISSGAIISLTPRLSFLHVHVLSLMAPGIAADVWLGGEGYTLALLNVVYILFVMVQGRHLNLQFRQALEARRQIESAKKMAEAANKAKSSFLTNISHELRTPMNGIIAMTELVLDTPLGNEQRDLLNTARSSALSLLKLLNDVLDFSKIEARHVELESIPFDVRKFVSETAAMLKTQARQKGLEMKHEVAQQVPRTLIGDPVRLRQVVVNLLGNAIRFTPAGHVAVRVNVETAHSEDLLLHFAVSDTGIGIPKDKQEIIFQPFAQADVSMTRKYGGTGLGLSISNSLVLLMRGNMWVESEPDRGSTFHFTARFGVPPSAQAEAPCNADGEHEATLVADHSPTLH